MLADAPQVLIDVGTVAGSITAIIVLLGLLSRLRPVKWLWKNLISEPFADWLKNHVNEAVEPIKATVDAELTPNGGGSMKDQIGELHDGQRAIRDEFGGIIREHERREMEHINDLEERQTELEHDMADMRDEQRTIHRLAVRLGRWTHQFKEFTPVKLHDLDLAAEQDELDQDLLEADPPTDGTDGES